MPPRSAPLIQNVFARSAQSLAGDWRVIVDPYDNGYLDYRGQPLATDGYFADRKPASKSDRIEYDFDRSETLRVPGDWNSQRPELFLYEGTVWYRTRFDAGAAGGRRRFLRFGAANYEARVWLNGTFAGSHRGGFTPFDVEVTSLLRQGSNSLVVMVNDMRRREGVPTLNTDWWNYGGLTRDVLLVDVPETFVRDWALHLAPEDPRRITGWVQLDGPTRRQPVVVRLPGLGLAVRVQTDAEGFARVELEAPSIERWTPERPRLHDVELQCDTDRVVDRIGFRTIEVRGGEILLNGAPVFLRGISVHEQAPRREGRACGPADARTLLGWAQELGANFVRLSHYPHDEHTVRLADELGLLVWEEIPVYWTIAWDDPDTLENARTQLTELVTRDRNRASVVLWSVGNETPPTEARLRFMRELVRTARALDPTRLVSAALERQEVHPLLQRVDDPLGADLDVLGCNEYLGWYDGLPDRPDGVRWETCHAKPLVMTELGADALHGLHGNALTRWTEEYQATFYEHQLRMLEAIPFLRGMSPWILADFRSPRRALPGVQDGWNRKGLVSDRGEKKLAFRILQDHYRALAARWR
ncbi:MAG TPA: glycoside hydrolase family 2 TIM barrel-domain containing protein [Anaeromyxobacter sp.]|nr:glycoside hydrolase family 2 TIM barrel-domain containing protein [Anaeromyxobacter sp.]